MKSRVLICSLLLVVFAFGAPAWAAKVKVCHVPPGNPANFHTITVDENAVQAHLGHGDLLGACFAHCDQLCDDGNACTIDACDAAEHCLATHPPVSCDDGNLCTVDSCDPAAGCASTPKVCHDSANCTVDTCDPLTGNCAFPPVSCPAGQSCNASNGSCENERSTCPCVGQVAGFADALNGAFGFTSCSDDVGSNGFQVFLNTASTNPDLSTLIAYSFPDFGPAACGFNSDGGSITITDQEAEACADLLRQKAAAAGLTCPGPAR